MDWATLFDRAGEHATTVTDVRIALATVRGERENDESGEEREKRQDRP